LLVPGHRLRDLWLCVPGIFDDSVLLTAVLEGDAMKRAIGSVVLGLSACGYLLTQLVIRRWGVRGAAVAECVCAGLAIRDASMVASGVPGRLRRFPAALLRLELAVGAVASLAGLHPLLGARPADRPAAVRTCAVESVRRAAVAALFAVHTIRFGIYLRPDRGRRVTQA
jgi:hypothetical protein